LDPSSFPTQFPPRFTPTKFPYMPDGGSSHPRDPDVNPLNPSGGNPFAPGGPLDPRLMRRPAPGRLKRSPNPYYPPYRGTRRADVEGGAAEGEQMPNIPNPFDTPIYTPSGIRPRDPDGDGRPGTPIYNPPVTPYDPRGNPYTNPPAPKTPKLPSPLPANSVEGEMPQMDPRMMQQMMMMMQQQGGMGGMPPMMNPQKKKI